MWYPEFDDFYITRIGDSTNTSTHAWQILVDFQPLDVGGCQKQVKEGQHILWAYAPLSTYLELEGPTTVIRFTSVTYTVRNGATHQPIKGATVSGETTDENGQVNITFSTLGEHTLKAAHPDAVRSNTLRINVVLSIQPYS